jgi:hypothetical protein
MEKASLFIHTYCLQYNSDAEKSSTFKEKGKVCYLRIVLPKWYSATPRLREIKLNSQARGQLCYRFHNFLLQRFKRTKGYIFSQAENELEKSSFLTRNEFFNDCHLYLVPRLTKNTTSEYFHQTIFSFSARHDLDSKEFCA